MITTIEAIAFIQAALLSQEQQNATLCDRVRELETERDRLEERCTKLQGKVLALSNGRDAL